MPWCPVTRCDTMWHDLIWYAAYWSHHGWWSDGWTGWCALTCMTWSGCWSQRGWQQRALFCIECQSSEVEHTQARSPISLNHPARNLFPDFLGVLFSSGKRGKVFFWDGETQSSSWLRPVPGIDGRWLVDGSEKTNGCLYTQYYLRDLRSIHKLFVYI